MDKLTKENLWIYILSSLKNGPDYALNLKRKVQGRFKVRAAKITFYFVLYRMEKEGLVVSRKEQGKRIYEATEKGKRELDRAIHLISDTLRLIQSE